MAGETIGNSRCSCIFPFEKHYLKLGLDGLIEDQNDKIKDIRDHEQEISANGVATPDTLIDIHERVKQDLETTRQRLNNTPDCQ